MKYLLALLLTFIILSCNSKEENMSDVDKSFKSFLDSVENKISKAYSDMALSYFNATISGKDEDFNLYAEKDKELNEILSNKKIFLELSNYKNSYIKDETLRRAAEVLFNNMLSKQIDTTKLNQISELQALIEKKFSTFRAKVGNKMISDNEVEEILKTSKDSKKLEEAWLAHKEIGLTVSEDVLNLVKLRNEAAKELGFTNYHSMTLKLSEQDPDSLLKFFDELDKLTSKGFQELKEEIDSSLATQYKIDKNDLMPWHYQNRYFQEAPLIYNFDLDELYKSQHAYCTDIDRSTLDIRVVCNVKPTSRWMETMLHEYGHAIYQKYVSQDIPWILKQPAHTFTTEGVAMLYGRLALSPSFMMTAFNLSEHKADSIALICKNTLRLQQLVFSRWVQVVYRFEKKMYEDPNQDLNKLWWDLVEKYQGLKRPANRNKPDWATKIHIAAYPCYYHNYLLGEIFASQFYAYMSEQILKNPQGYDESLWNKKEAAKFMVDNVYKPANLYKWDEMIKRATGESFTPKYYAVQFVE